MEIEEALNTIKKWSGNIEQLVYFMNINGKQYIQEYKIKDLKDIDTFIKKCERCGNYFIPNPNFKKYQQYCDIKCRNQATNENRYILKLDERQRPVDLLRKTIYERKYRARRDNKQIDIQGYDTILKKLKVLVKQRWELTEDEYNTRFEDLQYEYDKIVQKGKEEGNYEK